LASCIDPIEIGHPNVHDHDVWFQELRFFNSFTAIRGFSAYFPSWTFLQYGSDALSHEIMVISEQDTNGPGRDRFFSKHVLAP
jgi:hypothetical protein